MRPCMKSGPVTCQQQGNKSHTVVQFAGDAECEGVLGKTALDEGLLSIYACTVLG